MRELDKEEKFEVALLMAENEDNVETAMRELKIMA